MRFTVLTLFPEMVEPALACAMASRASEAGLVSFRVCNIRDWADNKHRSVDDAPYGGGGGMLMTPGPVCAALDAVAGPGGAEGRAHVICTSPAGRPWNQGFAEELAESRRDTVILCGRYEGIDQRVIDSRVDDEVSVGDFVLTGGELPALIIIDSVMRLLPGVLGNESSAVHDSFSTGLLEGPHYTRPELFEGMGVPDILLSGNHSAIEHWRHSEALRLTKERRPDLHEQWLRDHPPGEPARRRRRSKSSDS